jgi:hypothetical protein
MADPRGHAKVWVYCRSIAGIAGSNPSGLWMSLVSVVYCQIEVSATGRSTVERSTTECGVSECHRGNSHRGRRPTMAVQPRQEKKTLVYVSLKNITSHRLDVLDYKHFLHKQE